MEVAALYALATAKQYDIICFAHITNQMAQAGDDFEKGPDQGNHAVLEVIRQTARVVAAARHWCVTNGARSPAGHSPDRALPDEARHNRSSLTRLVTSPARCERVWAGRLTLKAAVTFAAGVVVPAYPSTSRG